LESRALKSSTVKIKKAIESSYSRGGTEKEVAPVIMKTAML
jgi:hypothetical protein